MAEAMLDGVRDLGLRLSAAARRLQARVELCRADGHRSSGFLGSGRLLDSIEDWLLPMLSGNVRSAEDWKAFDLLPALKTRGWTGTQSQLLDREAPGSFTTPLGRKIPIDYSSETRRKFRSACKSCSA